jgi:hypothetical protein
MPSRRPRRPLALLVLLVGLAVVGVVAGCGRGSGNAERSAGAGAGFGNAGASSRPPAEGEAVDSSEPVLPEDICVPSTDLVDRLLDGQQADPTITSSRGEQIFFEDVINLDTMIIGELSTCVWDPPPVTTHLATFVAWAPGDQLTPPAELGSRMFDRLLAPYTPQDGAPPLVDATVRPVAGLGEDARLVSSPVGSVSWLMARDGGLVVVVATLADPPDEEGLRAAAQELLDAGRQAVSRSPVSSPSSTSNSSGSGADQPVSGRLVTTGDLAGTWSFRPGGAFSCDGVVEIPLVSTDASAMGYLEVDPDGSARFGAGALGPSPLRGHADLARTGRDGDQTIEVDGTFTGSDGTVVITGTSTVQCPS